MSTEGNGGESSYEKDPSEILNHENDFIEKDPMCDESFPRTIHFEDVTSAAFKISSAVAITPCVRSQIERPGLQLYFKKDYLQYTGSFKERGARYALMMLTPEQQAGGVISASAGNHALALCHHGRQLQIPVTVVMPVTAPIMKVEKCRKMNAEVIVHGYDMAEAKQFAMKKGKQDGKTYINGYDHPDIMAGQGTAGLEVFQQVPDVDAVIVPVGGGGLIAGVATAIKGLKPSVQIIGVESHNCPSFTHARGAGKPVKVEMQSTLADGLAVPLVGYNAFATANNLVDDMVLVEEDWIAIAILRLVEQEKAVVEGAGAVGVAAVLSGQLDYLQGKKVVVFVCGGNIDTTLLGKCLERGLAAVGRLVKFSVKLSDRPGGMAALCATMAEMGSSIKDISQERAWVVNNPHCVSVLVVCETRNWNHTNRLMDVMRKNYGEVTLEAVQHPLASD